MSAPSYVIGDTSSAIDERTIGSVLRQAAAQWPSTEALVSVAQDVRLTYAELDHRVDQLAVGMMRLGLTRGQRVAVWAPNCAEWLLTQFATARLGLILVNINPAYRLSELEYTLNKVGVQALIAADAFKSSNYLAMLEELAPEAITSAPGALAAPRLPTLRTLVKLGAAPRAGWLCFKDIAAGLISPSDVEALRQCETSLDRFDPINIQFTSGTTGVPKGATLSHRNLVNNAHFVGCSMGLRQADRLCVPVPLYHCFGMVMSNLACVKHGATIVYPCAGFDPLAVLSAVATERCTLLHGVPTMFIAELEHPCFAEFDLRSLRGGIMAGSPCPIEIMRRVVDKMHMEQITIAYGMTETSPVSFQSSTQDSLERRVSTVGSIQPHMQAKVIDAQGNTLSRGEAGELCTRGYAVMLGYWGEPQMTADVVDAEGWMHTGDLAVIQDDGYCNIVGRSKDMIIRGGENVYPREVEEFLFTHPEVLDVAVVGVPDDKYGEAVCAWIRLRPQAEVCAEDIRDFCRQRIAHFKIPRYVEFVSEFPSTVTGKIQKYLIRKAMIEKLALTEHAHA